MRESSEFEKIAEQENRTMEKKKVLKHTERMFNILENLEEEGAPRFANAWENIGRSLFEIYEVMKRLSEDKAYDAILQEHKDAVNLWHQLNERFHQYGMKDEVITQPELDKAINGYYRLTKEFSDYINDLDYPDSLSNESFKREQ